MLRCLKCIKLTSIFFVLLTIYQLIFKDEVDWIENIIGSLIFFLVNFLYEWSKIPYKWNKNNKE